MSLSDGGGSPTRISVADEVLNHAKNIADASDELCEALELKLQRVSYPLHIDERKEEKEAEVGYPEYFSEMRKYLQSIIFSMRNINNTLDRTEI